MGLDLRRLSANPDGNSFFRQVAVRLREFATVRAMQTHAAAAAAASADGGGAAAAATLEAVVRASRGVDSGRPCKLRLRTAQVAPCAAAACV